VVNQIAEHAKGRDLVVNVMKFVESIAQAID